MHRKRFIAGAVCPQCQAKDTLFVLVTQKQQQIACVECDFLQKESQLPLSAKEVVIQRVKLDQSD